MIDFFEFSNYCPSKCLNVLPLRIRRVSRECSLGGSWVFQYQCSVLSNVRSLEGKNMIFIAILWWYCFPVDLSHRSEVVFICLTDIFPFFLFHPWLLPLTSQSTMPPSCLNNMSLFFWLNTPHHLSIVSECRDFYFSLSSRLLMKLLRNNTPNVKSCSITFSKLSTHYCLPPLRKLQIVMIIDGCSESLDAPLLNGATKISMNFFFWGWLFFIVLI